MTPLLDVEPNAVSVLLVEDDDVLRALLALHLRAANFSVRECASGDEALVACELSVPTTLVLDVMLPGRSGLEVCALVRATFDPSPGVVMLTARGEEADVIAGFSAGADDYVIKPCRPREVVARVQALARRLQPPRPAPQRIARGPVVVDVSARVAYVSGAPLKLTGTEFALLHYLARAHGVAFSRMQLLRDIFDSDLEAYARNVDCHITRLRRKLEAAGLVPSPIETVHGLGYRFTAHEGE